MEHRIFYFLHPNFLHQLKDWYNNLLIVTQMTNTAFFFLVPGHAYCKRKIAKVYIIFI